MYFSLDEQTICLWSFENELHSFENDFPFFSLNKQTYYFQNVENKLYTYQIFKGKKLGHKNLRKTFFEQMLDYRLSFDVQYCIKTIFHESPDKNQIIISQIENEEV
ncbi:hypothetical protein [Candidatus Protochlamydia sp. W-9]|uniref:hypothetical protein n=1 Tax=Candidatus Protochlamydia sp. W-9 TaxID=1785087 RepID=UPI001D0553A0|nr:hypothetical protein [Candidatus Protochlamydia sp. W-9]